MTWEDIGGHLNEFSCIAINSVNPGMVFAASKRSVYKTEDSGSSWKKVLTVKAEGSPINFIVIDRLNSDLVFAASNNGLYKSIDSGENWQRVFHGKDCKESACNSIILLVDLIYLGTQSGIFISTDKGISWQRAGGEAGRADVRALSCNIADPDYIYAASDRGVLRKLSSESEWERLFVESRPENRDETEDQTEESEEDKSATQINHLSIDPANAENVYLGTSNGVFRSIDKGKTWQAVTDEGLLSKDVRLLFITAESLIYAVTKSGIYELKENRWQDLSGRLVSGEIRFVTQDGQSRLYVAGEKGLFRSVMPNPEDDTKNKAVSLYPKAEPSIEEVQQAAISYAEVSPEKIKTWRKLAARKAWLPEVSMGLNRDTGDLLHWESGSASKDNDDILRKGKDSIDWDIALSWDLGELIWNNDQTSIDVRSRLMVELRDDILDEVTKLYFERIRVKKEIDNLSIEDRKKLAEKELRLQELTAYLDGMTGNFFSGAELETICNTRR
jgi:photosystem II stability/assembly factor-like uncharacterized protein